MLDYASRTAWLPRANGLIEDDPAKHYGLTSGSTQRKAAMRLCMGSYAIVDGHLPEKLGQFYN
eukprot:1162123-Pelagomonas_calceolata.AAC.6